MPNYEMNPAQPARDTASYYRGVFPLVICFLLSPAQWVLSSSLLLSDFSRRNSFYEFMLLLFAIVLLAALFSPRNTLLLQRAVKAALISSFLCAVAFAGVGHIVSSFIGTATAGLEDNSGDGREILAIAMSYLKIQIQFYCVISLFSFAALLWSRWYWNLSAALLLGIANLPLSAVLAAALLFARLRDG